MGVGSTRDDHEGRMTATVRAKHARLGDAVYARPEGLNQRRPSPEKARGGIRRPEVATRVAVSGDASPGPRAVGVIKVAHAPPNAADGVRAIAPLIHAPPDAA